jgi:hypothetical protein
MPNICKAPPTRMDPLRPSDLRSFRSPQASPASRPIDACDRRRCLPRRAPWVRALMAPLLLLAGSLVLSDGLVEAGEGKSIAGQFHMGLVLGPTCPSATGVCATGTVTGDLSGEIFITISDMREAPDRRGDMVTHLSGDLLITTIEGDMHGRLRGVFDQSTGDVRSTITLTGGDRRYRRMTGKLHVSGTVDLLNNIEEDDYQGELGQ